MSLITVDTKDINNVKLENKMNLILLYSFIKTNIDDDSKFTMNIEKAANTLKTTSRQITSGINTLTTKELINSTLSKDKDAFDILFISSTTIVYEKNENKKKDKEYSELIKSSAKIIIDYLNDKLGKERGFKPKTSYQVVSARLNDGYTVDDFKTVIDNMYNLWYRDQKMSQYLTPGTLFANKHFDDYLNKVTKEEKVGRRKRRKAVFSAEDLFDKK